MSEPDEHEPSIASDAQNAYYERVPEAPLDLYCILNASISNQEREEICKHVMFNLSGNLSADVLASINSNQSPRLDIQTFFFDDGVLKSDSTLIPVIYRALNQPGLHDLIMFKDSRTGDVAVRLQIEKVCIGYVKMNTPKIQDIADSIRRKVR